MTPDILIVLKGRRAKVQALTTEGRRWMATHVHPGGYLGHVELSQVHAEVAGSVAQTDALAVTTREESGYE